MKIQPNDPAYPLMPSHTDPGSILHTVNQGLTIRQHFAAMAMQGLWQSNPDQNYDNYAVIALMAVKQADALIEALNKEEQ